MKRIAFFAESKLVNTQKVRLGLSYFLKKKIQIKIFNIAPITRPEYFKKYLPPNIIEFPKDVILTNEKQAIDAIRNIEYFFPPKKENNLKLFKILGKDKS